MFYRQIDNEVKLGLTVPQFAEDIFNIVDKNRAFFSEWFPWVDSTTEVKDTEAYIQSRLDRFARGSTLHTTIFYHDKIVGVADLNTIDTFNRWADIGYWLDEEHNGKGIMSRVVGELIKIAFEEYQLEKVVIGCEVVNCRSCNIAKRLGFTHEGVLRQHYNINGVQKDMNLYGLLRSE